jgi:predicted phosphodiesterase
MLIAVLSDVHGHLLALEETLTSIKKRGCQASVFLGDAFGYLPDGLVCFDLLERNCDHLLSGNHEAMLVGKLPLPPERDHVYGLGELKESIDKDLKTKIMALPYRLELGNGQRALFVHGSPADPLEGYVYPDTSMDLFCTSGFDLIFMGHTHRPFIRTESKTVFVNVGSVGLPRGHEVGWSSWAVWNTEVGTVELIRRPLPASDYCFHPKIHESVKRLLRKPESIPQ